MLFDLSADTIFLGLACLGAFFMAFNNGANDVSNAFAAAVGSRSVSPRLALLLASAFTFSGAVFLGGKVALRLIEGLVEPGVFADPYHYTLAMLAVLFSAGLFVLLSTLTGLPVSSTHSIVGSLTGVNLVVLGWDAIDYVGLGWIALSWILSPILSAFLAFGLIWFIEQWMLPKKSKGLKRKIRQRLPLFVSLVVAFGLTGILLGSNHPWVCQLSGWVKMSLIIAIFVVFWIFLNPIVFAWTKKERKAEDASLYSFKRLQTWTACAVAFGNGANDVSNSISPVIAISWMLTLGALPDASEAPSIPLWILGIGGIGIILGILTLGHRVLDTLGRKITTLTPSRGFAIDLSVATVVISASIFGLPISTTHAATGGIIGGGLSRGSGGLHVGLLAKIFLAWVLTVPFAATITIVVYGVFRLLMDFTLKAFG